MTSEKLIGQYQDVGAVVLAEVPTEKRQAVEQSIRKSIDTRDWVVWWEDDHGGRRLVIWCD